MVKFNFLTNPSALYRGRGTVCESSLNHNCPFLKWTIISLISLIISPTKSRSRICISHIIVLCTSGFGPSLLIIAVIAQALKTDFSFIQRVCL